MSLRQAVHSITVSLDEKLALVGDQHGQLAPMDLHSYSTGDAALMDTSAAGEGLEDYLPRGVYNSPAVGPPRCMDAVSLRPLAAVLSENAWVK